MDNDAGKRSAGRPRAFDRAAALDVALHVFWRNGYEGTSTAQLTEAMGIAPPSLYAAFGSKESLYREALALYQARYGAYFPAALAASLPARAAMQQILEGAASAFCGVGHAPGCMVAAANIHCAPAHQAIAHDTTAARMAARDAIRERLEAARAAGELPDDCDTVALSSYFALVIQGMAVQAHDGADLATLKRMAALAMHAWPSSTAGTA